MEGITTLEIIQQILMTKYNELQEYTEMFNKKSEKDRQLFLEKKDIFAKDPEAIDLSVLGRDTLYINGFHQLDTRKMQETLLNAYNVYKEAGGEDDKFSTEFLNTIGALRAGLTKQFFIVKDKKFVEIEKGRLEKALTDYEEKGYFKIMESQIKKLLI